MNTTSTLSSLATLVSLCLVLALAGSFAVGCDDEPADGDGDGDTDADADADGEDVILPVTILQTSDTHHRASGYGAQLEYTPLDTSDSDPTLGGYARLATLINQIRTEQEAAGVPVVVVDSGDFLMGTIYDMTAEDPLAFKYFTAVGYDAVTFGNHEFDWGPTGIAMLIDNALASDPPFDVPIVSSNAILSDSDPGDDALAVHFDSGTVVDRLVLELDNGLRVGIMGIVGEGAEEDAVTAAPIDFVQNPVLLNGVADELRDQDGADLIVALSHSGINDDLQSGEDVDFAGRLANVDVFCSGHSHLATPTPIDVDGKLVIQPGEYGEWLSRLDLEYNVTQHSIESYTFDLIPVDDSIEGDAAVEGLVEDAHAMINPRLESALGLDALDPVVELSFDMPRVDYAETGLGDLCADALRASATQTVIGSDDETPFTFAVMPNGMVRDDLHASTDGLVTFSDMFNVMPLGLSPDPANQAMPGWPLAGAYVTAAELRNICEVSTYLAESIGSSSAYLNIAGVRCEYDPAGEDLHTVTRVFACGNTLPTDDGGDGDIFSTDCDTELDLADDTTLYRGVFDIYTFLSLGQVTPFFPLAPKHANGEEIDLSDSTDYMSIRLDVDHTTAGIQELANWVSLLMFLEGLEDTGGDPMLPDIPADVYDVDGSGLGRFFTL